MAVSIPIHRLSFYLLSTVFFSTGHCRILHDSAPLNSVHSGFYCTKSSASHTAQQQQQQPIPKKLSSYRGVSTNPKTVWISGSNGTVLKLNSMGTEAISSTKSIPALIHQPSKWDTLSPEGYEKYDFRDIESLDDKTAIIMSVGDSSSILKTVNAGKNWSVVYKNYSSNVFLDAVAMDWKTGFGFAIGDPQTNLELLAGDSFNSINFDSSKASYSPIKTTAQIRWIIHSRDENSQNVNPSTPHVNPVDFLKQKYFLMLVTLDSGNTWQRIPACEAILPQDSIASFFAGSGSSLHILRSSIKRNKTNQITHIDVLVGMAGGGINPEFRALKIQLEITAKVDNKTSNTLPLSVSHQSFPLSLGHGAGWGAYGGAFHDGALYWVGGNYLYPTMGDSTIIIFPKSEINRLVNTKKTTASIASYSASSSGYKSGICNCAFKNNLYLFAAGSNGIDVSSDQGKTWLPVHLSATNIKSIPSKKSTSVPHDSQINSSNTSHSVTHTSNNKDNSINSSIQFSGINAVGCYKGGIIVVGNKGQVFYLSARP